VRLIRYVNRKGSRCARNVERETPWVNTLTTVERWMETGECRGLAADELIAVLLDQRQHWIYRAWSAVLLASRNEKAISEALSHASQRDPVYWVRRDALRSLRLRARDLEHELCLA